MDRSTNTTTNGKATGTINGSKQQNKWINKMDQQNGTTNGKTTGTINGTTQWKNNGTTTGT